MGRILTQRTLECDGCGHVPEDGAHLWEMGWEILCESCCDDYYDPAEEIPQFEGTREQLESLKV